VRAPDAMLDPGLGAVRDLLGHEHGEEVAIAEALGFDAVHQPGISRRTVGKCNCRRSASIPRAVGRYCRSRFFEGVGQNVSRM